MDETFPLFSSTSTVQNLSWVCKDMAKNGNKTIKQKKFVGKFITNFNNYGKIVVEANVGDGF